MVPHRPTSSSPPVPLESTAGAREDADAALPLLQRRLVKAGVPGHEISFRRDDEDPVRRDADDDSGDAAVVHIKTLVWEITCRHDADPYHPTDPIGGDDHRGDGDGDSAPADFTGNNGAGGDCRIYVVSALRLDDKVEVGLLRDLVSLHHGLPVGYVPHRLAMAPREVAEGLTGFRSGTMPPIAHSPRGSQQQDLALYVDSSVVNGSLSCSAGSNSGGDCSVGIDRAIMASIGSGMLGKSLVLPLHRLLEVAATAGGVHVGPLVARGPQMEAVPGALPPPDGGSLPPPGSPQARRRQVKAERQGRHLQRKDRLEEYRTLSGTVAKAKLLRTTARRRGRFDRMEELVGEAVRVGDFPHLLEVQPTEGLSRNVLHMAAWRGDIETVQLLVETAGRVCPQMDAVNYISTGGGNYGKTPIFFALTQCREDVVRYLVSQGADLLIVNNKGQTPCSIAGSHLNEEACQFLYEVEAEQLRAGGTFSNYRQTHSDEQLYGDLDPRFPIDSFNFGDDLAEQVDQYHESLIRSDPSATLGGFPTQFRPRSLRPTVRWWNRPDASLRLANEDETAGLVTFTQPRRQTLENEKVVAREGPPSPEPRMGRSPSRDELADPGDIGFLEVLSLDSVLETEGPTRSVVLVNCSDTIRQLKEDVDASIASLSDPQHSVGLSKDAVIVNSAWGLDCEWKPGSDRGKHNPVATLQLSTFRQAYLVDLQSLCQSNDGVANLVPSVLELQLNQALSGLFEHTELSVIGFGILQDLGKLATSFPHLSCFSYYASVLDLQTVASSIYQKKSRAHLSSLQKMAAIFLSKQLDKSEQCSDWTQRPLSSSQVAYACLDAAVLPLLFKTIMAKSVTVDRYSGQFFAVHSSLLTNVRFTLLDSIDDSSSKRIPATDDTELAWSIPSGSIRHALSREVARQCWPSNQATPSLPSQVVTETNPITNKEKAHIAKVGSNGKKKQKPIQLKTLTGNLDNLPTPGIELGYTKDSCTERVLGHEFMNTLPERTHIGFNRRSGVVETKNAWIIFCNFGGTITKQTLLGRHGSEFSEDGKFLSFNLNPQRQHGQSSEKTLMDYVSSNGSKSVATAPRDKAILLFAREGSRSKYTFCGACECKQCTTIDRESTDLLLELTDHSILRQSIGFKELVRSRQILYGSLESNTAPQLCG